MEQDSKCSREFSKRERLREKGQFWTPDWIAEGMVGYLISEKHRKIFDPAVGTGAFFHAAKKLARENNIELELSGMEIDPSTLTEAKKHGLADSDLADVHLGDFVLNPPKEKIEAIVANPPYVRHHRLKKELKAELKKLALRIIGRRIDGRAGLHIYFLLRALEVLDQGGKLAFIMPADTVEGVFAPTLWNWITRNYRLEAVVTFTPKATPFPEVDTNPLIFLIRRAKPQQTFYWVICSNAHTAQLKEWTLSGLKTKSTADLLIHERSLSEALKTGFSRPCVECGSEARTLFDFARVMRGVATGANEFFFMTAKQAKALEIPSAFLVRAIGRTRDIKGDELTIDMLDELDAKNRPTFVFSPGGRAINEFPKSIREYLKLGETRGLNKRPLIRSRTPWYKMETRSPPPIIFTYLGRRDARFIANRAGAIPLTGFLCIYPRQDDSEHNEKLLRALRHPQTIANLKFVGKTYGGGAIKVEPRALERLSIPVHILREVGIEPSLVPDQGIQATLF
jgi:hypothetical protein